MFILRDYQKKLITDLKKSLIAGHHNVVVQSPAGSGKTVTMAAIAKSATDKGNIVLFIVHRREIVEQVKKTFKAYGVNMILCYVGMVQTVTRRLKGLEVPQLILVDECHHSLAKSYTRIFEYFKNANVVGFTATPVRLSGQGLSKVFDDLILGPRIDWLIDNHYLAPYEYYSVKLIDDNKLKRNSTGDFSSSSMNEASKNIIYGDVIKEYKRIANGTKAIVYTYSVKSSIKVAAEFNQAGYKALQVDGNTAKEKREQAMNDFRSGKVQILVNAELYGEGVDVPDCQTVIMLRPTESLSLFIQQSMRCMRYKPNKTATIIDHVANYKRFGLPDTPRTWSLKGRDKKKSSSDSSVPIRTCPHCFAVISSAYSTCPICGYEIPIESTEMKIDKSAKVERITKDFKFKTNYEEIHYREMEPKDAKSFKDLGLIAKARKYKPGWAYYQAKQRGFIKH